MSTRSRLRVLAVENDPVFREFLSIWFESQEVDSVIVEDGLRALDELRIQDFDLLMTDLIMPYIDGSTLCNIVRRRKEWSSLYVAVIIATAAEDPDMVNRVPADIFIAKRPLNLMKADLSFVMDSLMAGERPEKRLLGVENIYSRRITKELLDENRAWAQAYANLHEGILGLSENNRIVAMNPAAATILGVTTMDVLGRSIDDVAPKLRLPGDEPRQQEYGQRWIELSSTEHLQRDTPILTLILRDVTDEHRAEVALKKNVEDKELMLRELHHRLKNNLLMVAGYVGIQIEDVAEESRGVLQTIRANLESIAMAHERLYRHESVSELSFDDYLRDVVRSLAGIYAHRINLDIDLQGEGCTLEMDRALRLGLVVNELIMNALQHAFPEGTGTIRVSLTSTKEGTARLSVQDDGVGLPQDRNEGGSPQKEESFGLQIIHALVDDVDGTITFEGDNGTHAVIDFGCR